MKRLLIHVEGETEEMFVNEVLAPHLYGFGFESVAARLLGNARSKTRRGGIKNWDASKKDLIRHLKADSGCCSTTMVDYYALPAGGAKGWPGRDDAVSASFSDKAGIVESAVFDDVCGVFPELRSNSRFIPFVLMHEFEALLFSDCARLASGIYRPELATEFQAIRNEFSCPEEINDSPQTAPSKRLNKLVPGYQKPLFGILAAEEIGLEKIRGECPHFNDWITRLEALPEL